MNNQFLLNIASVFIGGSIGSVLRYLSGFYLSNWFGTTFPWGTLFVNIVGSFVLGFVMSFAINKPNALDSTTRLILTTGFCGGFTTFSSFAWETLSLYQKGDATLAIANLSSNLVFGFLACFIGYVLGRMI
ncbi:MAG TPA: fluoride efflux transporter CrcB [Drouetiella sp.]